MARFLLDALSRQLRLPLGVLTIAVAGTFASSALAATTLTPKLGSYAGSTSQGSNMAADFKVLKRGDRLLIAANVYLRVHCSLLPGGGANPFRSEGIGDPSYVNIGAPAPIGSKGNFVFDREISRAPDNFTGGETGKIRINGRFTSPTTITGTASLIEKTVKPKGSYPGETCEPVSASFSSREVG